MLVVNISEGLGNQLFQYVHARNLSLKFGKKLYLDLSFYNNGNKRKFMLDNFCIDYKTAEKEEFIFYKTNKLGVMINEFNRLLTLVNISPLTTHYISGYGQYYQSFKSNLDLIIEKELSIKNDIRDSFKNYQIYNEVTDNKNSVALHVRRGDYVDRKRFDLCTREYYNKAIHAINEKTDNPHFYIFSEDRGWCSENLEFGGKNFSYVKDIRDDFMEFCIMSSCRNFIISNSTYSWWSAMLSKSEGKNVIAPFIWIIERFGTVRYTRNFVPENWELIEFRFEKKY